MNTHIKYTVDIYKEQRKPELNTMKSKTNKWTDYLKGRPTDFQIELDRQKSFRNKIPIFCGTLKILQIARTVAVCHATKGITRIRFTSNKNSEQFPVAKREM